jgi:PAS domain S-box-containing protein
MSSPVKQSNEPEWVKENFPEVKVGAPDPFQTITQPWPYFYLIIDYSQLKYYDVNGSFEQITGYKKDIINHGSAEQILSLIHPDDREKVSELNAYFHDFIHSKPEKKRKNYKASMDFRIRRMDGRYIRLMEQTGILQLDEKGRIATVVKFFTEITHLDKEDKIWLTILNDEEDMEDRVKIFSAAEKTKKITVLTKREIEIIRLIADGASSPAIARKLFLSEHTVKNHRKNIFKKLKLRNSSQLISYSIQHGLI